MILFYFFVRRGGNSVAHEVANLTVSMSLHQLWINYFPSSLSVCIRKDYCDIGI
jgi:hypothetical protein